MKKRSNGLDAPSVRRAGTARPVLATAALLLVTALTVLFTPMVDAAAPAAPISATVTGNTNLLNLQELTVNWTNFLPTKTDFTGRLTNYVGVYECEANPPGGIWNYYTDCYTQPSTLDRTNENGGNAADPFQSVGTYAGITAASGPAKGTGTINFQVQTGTLHTVPTRFLCSTVTTSGYQPPDCNPPFNIQCDATHACDLLVVEFPGEAISPNNPWPPGTSPDPVDSWSYFASGVAGSSIAASDTKYGATSIAVPLNFGAPNRCGSSSAAYPSAAVEGANEASYAVQVWAAALCDSKAPSQIDFTELPEFIAEEDLAGGATNAAIASVPPPDPSNYFAAPLDVAGLAITFQMQDAVTHQIIRTVRLTPRLLAMLITNSAVLGSPSSAPVEHTGYTIVSGHPVTFTYTEQGRDYSLTADPEFQALNPGFTVPQNDPGQPDAFLNVVDPLLPAGKGDDAEVLTQWIADDHDAQQFLKGDDACGAPLNAYWAPKSTANPNGAPGGVVYPVDQFTDLEQGGGVSPGATEAGYAALYEPVLNLHVLVQDYLNEQPSGFIPPYIASITKLGALSAALSTGGPITSLPVTTLTSPVLPGTVVVDSGANTQTFTTPGASTGATSIPVTSATPNFAYPAGSTVTTGGQQVAAQLLNPIVPYQQSLFGVFDVPTAASNLMTQSSLIAADPTGSELTNYVTESGGTCAAKSLSTFPGFVAPTAAGLSEGAADSTVNAAGSLTPPYESTDPAAYPLTRVDYLYVPKTGLTEPEANTLAALIRYATTTGQSPTTLPPGYVPLPDNLVTGAQLVANEIQASAVPKPAPPTTKTTTTAPTTTTPTTTPASISITGSIEGYVPSSPLGDTAPAGSGGLPVAAAPGSSGSLPGSPARSAAGRTATRQLEALQASVDTGNAGILGGGWLLPLLAVLVLGTGGGSALLWWRFGRPAKGTK